MERFRPSKAVWVYRSYDDVVNSMLISFDDQSNQILSIANDINSSSWRGRGMSDETHALVKEMANPDISDASAAALLWYFRNILFFEQGFDTNYRVKLVKYESLVTEPQQEFKRIMNFLELEYTERLSSKVHSGSVRKRKEPELDERIRKLCTEMQQRLDNVYQAQKEAFSLDK
jgi:hypothetical protein